MEYNFLILFLRFVINIPKYLTYKKCKMAEEDYQSFESANDLPNMQRDQNLPNEERMREKLLDDIRYHIERIESEVGLEGDQKRTKNIVFIGPIGVGKSSTLNSTAASASRKYWKVLAEPGSYGLGGTSKTIVKKT